MQQLGGKLETNLKLQETQLNSTKREEASKRRATLIKLTRDFRSVEVVYKNLVLDTRRRKARIYEQKQQQYNVSSSNNTENNNNSTGGPEMQGQADQGMQLELQLQQEVSLSCWKYVEPPSAPWVLTHCIVCFPPSQQRLNEEIMRERENEIRNINRGMHQVNEIYKVCWCFSSRILYLLILCIYANVIIICFFS